MRAALSAGVYHHEILQLRCAQVHASRHILARAHIVVACLRHAIEGSCAVRVVVREIVQGVHVLAMSLGNAKQELIHR